MPRKTPTGTILKKTHTRTHKGGARRFAHHAVTAAYFSSLRGFEAAEAKREGGNPKSPLQASWFVFSEKRRLEKKFV